MSEERREDCGTLEVKFAVLEEKLTQIHTICLQQSNKLNQIEEEQKRILLDFAKLKTERNILLGVMTIGASTLIGIFVQHWQGK